MTGPSGIALPPGAKLHAHKALDSTNAEALRRLSEGARPLTVIWAREQTAGRGRDGRAWASPPGNLYATLLAGVPPGRAPAQAAFVAALAAGDAILALCPEGCDLRYKWPNDILVAGRKAGGILIEGGACGTGKEVLAIGIGINVESAPQGTPWPATCLRAEGPVEATVAALLERLIAAFAARAETWRTEGFAGLGADWLARAFGLGDALRVRLPGGAAFDGTFRGLDADGALLLDQGAQGVRRIAAGDVMLATR